MGRIGRGIEKQKNKEKKTSEGIKNKTARVNKGGNSEEN